MQCNLDWAQEISNSRLKNYSVNDKGGVKGMDGRERKDIEGKKE